jgi:hypothetical protein
VRYDRGVLESFVDLTYRGLSLGRRVRLSQVRPSSGFLELPAPMPVGTAIGVTTDDGATFEAMVTSIHEQVAGSERSPGMTVTPALTGDAPAAWWAARVSLPDDARPRTVTAGGRSRPVTVRPRSHSATDALRAAEVATTDEVPTVVADLDALVAAAAAAPGPVDVTDARTIVMPVIELEADAPPEGEGDGEAGGDPGARFAASPVRTPEIAEVPEVPMMRHTGEHAVVDDGNRTMIMESIDPATLGIDFGTAGDDDSDGADDADLTDPGDPDPAGPATVPDGGAIEPSSRGRKKRRSRR